MAFEEYLKKINWNEALTLLEENPNMSFKTFLNIVDTLKLISTALKNTSPKQNIK